MEVNLDLELWSLLNHSDTSTAVQPKDLIASSQQLKGGVWGITEQWWSCRDRKVLNSIEHAMFIMGTEYMMLDWRSLGLEQDSYTYMHVSNSVSSQGLSSSTAAFQDEHEPETANSFLQNAFQPYLKGKDLYVLGIGTL